MYPQFYEALALQENSFNAPALKPRPSTPKGGILKDNGSRPVVASQLGTSGSELALRASKQLEPLNKILCEAPEAPSQLPAGAGRGRSEAAGAGAGPAQGAAGPALQ